MAVNANGKTIGLVLLATLVLFGCNARIDSQEKAEEAIAKAVAKKIKPTFRENQSRANIRLSKTNLLSLLPDLNDYPINIGRRDSSKVESVEIFTSSEKAGRGRDGFYNELAEEFNRQNIRLPNGKIAAVFVGRYASRCRNRCANHR